MEHRRRPQVALPEPRVEQSPRWVRVRAGREWVADSRRALLLAWYGPGRLPTYCVPADDVRTNLLRASADGGASPFICHDIVLADRIVPGAALLARDLPGPLAEANGHWTFTWDGSVSWFEEAQEIHVHARDTSKRVDAMPSERHVRIELGGRILAESRRPVALFETPLPPRWYLPPADVELDLLEPSQTVTCCPYKGTARLWSVRGAGAAGRDMAWCYPEPIPECPRIAGLIAFLDENLDLTDPGRRGTGEADHALVDLRRAARPGSSEGGRRRWARAQTTYAASSVGVPAGRPAPAPSPRRSIPERTTSISGTPPSDGSGRSAACEVSTVTAPP